MEKLNNYDMGNNPMGKIVMEGYDKLESMLASKPIKDLEHDIDVIKNKVVFILTLYLVRAIKKDSRLQRDIDELDKRYELGGDHEKLLTMLAWQIKEVDCFSSRPKQTILRKILCSMMQVYYYDTCYPEDICGKILTVYKYQILCGLMWSLCDFQDNIKKNIRPGFEQECTNDLVSILYRIKGCLSALEFVDALKTPLISEVMIPEDENELMPKLGTINQVDHILEEYTMNRSEFYFHGGKGGRIPVHSHGLTEKGMPELLVNRSAFGDGENGYRIEDVYNFLKRPENNSAFETIRNGGTIKVTPQDIFPKYEIDIEFPSLCLRRVNSCFVETHQIYGPEDMAKDIWFIQIYADGDDDALINEHHGDGAC